MVSHPSHTPQERTTNRTWRGGDKDTEKKLTPAITTSAKNLVASGYIELGHGGPPKSTQLIKRALRKGGGEDLAIFIATAVAAFLGFPAPTRLETSFDSGASRILTLIV